MVLVKSHSSSAEQNTTSCFARIEKKSNLCFAARSIIWTLHQLDIKLICHAIQDWPPTLLELRPSPSGKPEMARQWQFADTCTKLWCKNLCGSFLDPTVCATLGLAFSYPLCHLSAKSHTMLTIQRFTWEHPNFGFLCKHHNSICHSHVSMSSIPFVWTCLEFVALWFWSHEIMEHWKQMQNNLMSSYEMSCKMKVMSNSFLMSWLND